MKRNLAIFAICASFLFLFAACGEDTAQDMANGANDAINEAGDMVDDAVTGAKNMMRSSGRDFSGNTGAIQRETYGNTNATANTTLHGTYNNPTGTRGGSTGSYGSYRVQEEDTDPAAETTRYQLMLDNARVHDTDGFLLDGENAKNDTF